MWIIDDDHIGLFKNVVKFFCILFHPGLVDVLVLLGEYNAFVRDGLQDIVKFCFGHIKGFFSWGQDIPMGINLKELEEPDQGMAHQSNAPTLCRRIKKYQLLACKPLSKRDEERKFFSCSDLLIICKHVKCNRFYFVVGGQFWDDNSVFHGIPPQ